MRKRFVRFPCLTTLLPLLVACDTAQPIDCTQLDLAAFERCYDQNRAKGEVAALTGCLPFSRPLTTEGIWVVGFEKNDFFEGPQRPHDKLLWTGSTGAELIVDEEQRPKTPDHQTQAFEVEVSGRRALCSMGVLNPYPIAVEKLKIRRRIG